MSYKRKVDDPRVKGLMEKLPLALRLLLDRRVGFSQKMIPLLAIFYILSPLDFMPEVILGPFGVLDDIGVFLLGLEAFIRFSPHEVVMDHVRRLRGYAPQPAEDEDIIEGEYVIRDR